LGCGEGSCGSCTVLISQCIDRESGEIEHRTVNGCLAPLCSVDGCHVITVEGLGSLNKSSLRSTQNRLSELSSSQCGFCTPGMVMSLYGTISSKSNFNPTIADIEEAFDGHLCRSTGYRSILNVAKRFASDTNKIHYDNSSSLRPSTTFDKCLLFPEENSLPFDQIQFPEKLRDYIPQSIHIKGKTLFLIIVN
jgi:xanthine dehydrogenase iron-sulfur cluster and FAD-binding subunit A